MANRECIGIQVLRKALVCHVDERHQLALNDHIGNRPPLIFRRIDPGRIVAARVQQHEVAGRHLRQCFQHRVDPKDVLVGVVVRVALQIQPGASQ